MQIGDRVKFSDHFLQRVVNDMNRHWRFEKREGTVLAFYGKNNLRTKVKWDNLKTPVSYHCTFIIKI